MRRKDREVTNIIEILQIIEKAKEELEERMKKEA